MFSAVNVIEELHTLALYGRQLKRHVAYQFGVSEFKSLDSYVLYA